MTDDAVPRPLPMGATVVAASHVISAGLSGEAAMLNLHDGVYYGLNRVGARIWELIQEPRSVASIRDQIVSEFDVEPVQCERDLVRLIGELTDAGLLAVTDAPSA